MINSTWEIDDKNTVKATRGAFGKSQLLLNDKPILEKIKFKKNEIHKLKLEDGRDFTIEFQQTMFGSETFVLKLGDEIVLPNMDDFNKVCSSCGAVNNPNDKFCTKCGNALPSAEYMMAEQKVKGARTGMKVLAVMFALFGAFMFFAQQKSVNDAMTNLNQYEDHQIWPEPYNGKQVTVGELKNIIRAEQWYPLLSNVVLAFIMFGLSFWAKSRPLPSTIIAAAIYGVVLVGNAIVEPQSIRKGWIMKIIFISILYNGIKSALTMRQLKGK